MPNYLVTWNINGARDYQAVRAPLLATLRMIDPMYVHTDQLESTCIVTTEMTRQQVADRLSEILDRDDGLLVAAIGPNSVTAYPDSLAKIVARKVDGWLNMLARLR